MKSILTIIIGASITLVLWWNWPWLMDPKPEVTMEEETIPQETLDEDNDDLQIETPVVESQVVAETLAPADEKSALNQKVPTQKVEEKEPVSPAPPPTLKAVENVSAQFKARDFHFPEKYPGYNMEVLEEKKVEFLIRELNLYPADAQEVSNRYTDSLAASNEVMRRRPESAMKEMSQIVADYEEWAKDKLGSDDFLRYQEFVDLQMQELQGKYQAEKSKTKKIYQ